MDLHGSILCVPYGRIKDHGTAVGQLAPGGNRWATVNSLTELKQSCSSDMDGTYATRWESITDLTNTSVAFIII